MSTSYATPPPPGASAQAAGARNPYAQPLGASTSPGLAFALGWIPGVGAIYNGQYMKGLVHAVIFGLLISLASSLDHTAGQPLLVMLMVGFIFYMPFEAYHTAKRRHAGIAVDEWSSLVASNRYTSRAPIGPVLLICFGVLFLLDTLRLIEFSEIARFWPVLLILAGAVMLYNRVSSPSRPLPPAPPMEIPAPLESRHEQ